MYFSAILDENECVPEENWRNKNAEPRSKTRKRRSKYSILTPLTESFKAIIHLQNTYIQRGKPRIRTSLTCAFDSLFQAMVAFYTDDVTVRELMNNCKPTCKLSNLIKLVFDKRNPADHDLNHIYVARNKIIIEDLFNNRVQVYKNGLLSVDCNCNINYIIGKLFCENLNSFRKLKKCNICHRTHSSERIFVDFDIDKFALCDMSELNNLLFESLNRDHRQCNCGGKMAFENIVFNTIITVDLELRNNLKSCSIMKLPQDLKLFDNSFKLVGVIEFIGDPKNITSIGHYVCHARRKNLAWERYDNLVATVTKSNVRQIIQPQILFYKNED